MSSRYSYDFHDLLHKFVGGLSHRIRSSSVILQSHLTHHVGQIQEDFDPATQHKQMLLHSDRVPQEVGVPPENLKVQSPIVILKVDVQETALTTV